MSLWTFRNLSFLHESDNFDSKTNQNILMCTLKLILGQ